MKIWRLPEQLPAAYEHLFKYRVGHVVWGQLEVGPEWPGYITALCQCKRADGQIENIYELEFFNDETKAYLQLYRVYDFKENLHEFERKTLENDKFRRAINFAKGRLKMRVEYEPDYFTISPKRRRSSRRKSNPKRQLSQSENGESRGRKKQKRTQALVKSQEAKQRDQTPEDRTEPPFRDEIYMENSLEPKFELALDSHPLFKVEDTNSRDTAPRMNRFQTRSPRPQSEMSLTPEPQEEFSQQSGRLNKKEPLFPAFPVTKQEDNNEQRLSNEMLPQANSAQQTNAVPVSPTTTVDSKEKPAKIGFTMCLKKYFRSHRKGSNSKYNRSDLQPSQQNAVKTEKGCSDVQEDPVPPSQSTPTNREQALPKNVTTTNENVLEANKPEQDIVATEGHLAEPTSSTIQLAYPIVLGVYPQPLMYSIAQRPPGESLTHRVEQEAPLLEDFRNKTDSLKLINIATKPMVSANDRQRLEKLSSEFVLMGMSMRMGDMVQLVQGMMRGLENDVQYRSYQPILQSIVGMLDQLKMRLTQRLLASAISNTVNTTKLQTGEIKIEED